MNQPKINIFGGIYKVIQIEFHKGTGQVEKVVYQVDGGLSKSVFRGDEMITKSLTSTFKIQKPTEHPYHNYAYAPNLEKLLVNE